MPIRSDRDTAVVDPGGTVAFEITVRGPDGAPAVAVALRTSAMPGDAVRLESEQISTDDAGRARIVVHAQKSAEVTLTAVHEADRWQGTLYVTGVLVTTADRIRLAPIEQELLRMLFRDLERVHVLKELAGGLSGNRVLRVQPFDARGALLTRVVKLGGRDEIRAEGANYALFRDRLPSAAPVAHSVEAGTRAAIIYGDAAAAGSLQRVVSLGTYYAEHEPDQVHAALCAVLGSGMRRVHGRYRVDTQTYGDLVGSYLPEHLVVSLGGGATSCAIYPLGRAPALSACVSVQPRDVELRNYPLEDTRSGDLVALRGFRIGKLQDSDLNLEDEQRRRYRIKVRYDAPTSDANGPSAHTPPAHGFATGDRVDVIARFVAGRDARIGFAVRDCFERQGVAAHANGFELNGEVYPDPLALLPRLLGETTDVACGTIHGDLHWDNVMLEGPSNWWLIDYGLTRADGPILFDFVKLEVYLRRSELAPLQELEPDAVLAFERDLVDNPFGRLPAVKLGHVELEKAADAIRTIRRLARPYMLDGYAGYLRLVFAYALALSKYYPTEDRWAAAEEDGARFAPLRKAARQTFVAFAPALAIGRVLAWERLREKATTLRFGFRPMGTMLTPQAGTVALDVGNRLEPGVIDHHHLEHAAPECTTTLVHKRPELALDHLAGLDPDDARWLVHEWPDFDCVASTYLAWIRAKLGFFPPGAEQLARYAFAVDAGGEFLERARFPERTPYALFALHLHESNPRDTSLAADVKRMRCGFAVMDYLCRQEVAGRHTLAMNMVPHEHGFWNANMREDRAVFDDLDRRLAEPFETDLQVARRLTAVNGLVMASPRSLFFKIWARRDGFPLLVVEWLQPNKPDHRIVVSVPPSYSFALKGLGRALERAESEKRRMFGKERPTDQPRWADVDNSDPWYDGRSPIHAYTIVDSPHAGTVLSVAEVRSILMDGKWRETGPEAVSAL